MKTENKAYAFWRVYPDSNKSMERTRAAEIDQSTGNQDGRISLTEVQEFQAANPGDRMAEYLSDELNRKAARGDTLVGDAVRFAGRRVENLFEAVHEKIYGES